LVELRRDSETIYTAKFSDDKSTLPGAKQIYRYPTRDVVALYSECNGESQGEPLLRPIIAGGQLVEALPPIQKIQQCSQTAIAALPKHLHALDEADPYPVEISPRLLAMAESLRQELQPARP
jgi:nicotinate phosphoribosyltransferase